jgi:hypothetical protein
MPTLGLKMTQTCKQILTILAFVLPLLGMVPPSVQPAQAQSVVTLIVTDPFTGVAISGMDPVSYFTEPEPLRGRADYEFVWQNVIWQFATPANRDIFASAPEIYAPQFGGHDVTGVSRGFISDSDATMFTVFKQRICFIPQPTARLSCFRPTLRPARPQKNGPNCPKISLSIELPGGPKPARRNLGSNFNHHSLMLAKVILCRHYRATETAAWPTSSTLRQPTSRRCSAAASATT